MLRLLMLLAILLQGTTVFSALNDTNARINTIRQVIDGYNRQEYKAMRQPWVAMGKLVVTEKKLRAEFAPFYERNGTAAIDTVILSSPYAYVAKLRMQKRQDARVYLQFIFADNGKIEGFGFSYPPLVYRKSKKSGSIQDAQLFNSHLDTVISKKYRSSATTPFNGSVVVLDNGQPIYQKHFGYADYNLKTSINDTTLYELASCSKQFTATAILLLMKDGRLQLQDSVQKFIPGFPYRPVTIEQLLTHSSGLPDYEELLERVWDKSKFATNNDVLEAFKTHKPKMLFTSGERFEYSNSGYVVLSSIIEKASGQSYVSFLKDRIFAPLGMNHTRVYNTRRVTGERLPNYAYGYVYSSADKKYKLPDSMKQHQIVVYQDAITGDGTVNSCTQDLIKWENELLHHKLLDKTLFDIATSKHKLKSGKAIDYGYGFILNGGGESERLVFHTGGWPGYTSIIMNFFDLKKQIIILSNNNYDDFTRMADDIAGMLLEG